MNRGESNSKRTVFKKYAVNKADLRAANRVLGKSGVRICRYTGTLLELNDENFNKLKSDKFGYQSVSKLGLQLYRDGFLEVKESDKMYKQHDRSGRKTAA